MRDKLFAVKFSTFEINLRTIRLGVSYTNEERNLHPTFRSQPQIETAEVSIMLPNLCYAHAETPLAVLELPGRKLALANKWYYLTSATGEITSVRVMSSPACNQWTPSGFVTGTDINVRAKIESGPSWGRKHLKCGGISVIALLYLAGTHRRKNGAPIVNEPNIGWNDLRCDGSSLCVRLNGVDEDQMMFRRSAYLRKKDIKNTWQDFQISRNGLYGIVGRKRTNMMSEEIWAAINSEVLRADEGEASAGMKGRGKREIPENTRRPAASSGTIPICKNPEATPPEIEPDSHRWEASSYCYAAAVSESSNDFFFYLTQLPSSSLEAPEFREKNSTRAIFYYSTCTLAVIAWLFGSTSVPPLVSTLKRVAESVVTGLNVSSAVRSLETEKSVVLQKAVSWDEWRQCHCDVVAATVDDLVVENLVCDV
ncbi:hypothetical protein PR048_009918 [Dryococelus australis]|uniref:Uncharacterized protein n=1 Tax=Dryococelus australis TaxID=614101 RepID=A0ABQ9I2B0_9NEOP|nr:hypothetical protein PR048_009918 [Dryococelus australis]